MASVCKQSVLLARTFNFNCADQCMRPWVLRLLLYQHICDSNQTSITAVDDGLWEGGGGGVKLSAHALSVPATYILGLLVNNSHITRCLLLKLLRLYTVHS